MLEKIGIVLGLCLVIFVLTYFLVKIINNVLELKRIDRIVHFMERKCDKDVVDNIRSSLHKSIEIGEDKK